MGVGGGCYVLRSELFGVLDVSLFVSPTTPLAASGWLAPLEAQPVWVVGLAGKEGRP